MRCSPPPSRWPAGGAFGPAIVTPDGQLYPSARALPSLGRGIGHALAGWWWPTNPWTASYRQERESPVEGECGWLSGSALLVRREAFEAVGGFDPKYFMYFEDVDLCDRLGARRLELHLRAVSGRRAQRGTRHPAGLRSSCCARITRARIATLPIVIGARAGFRSGWCCAPDCSPATCSRGSRCARQKARRPPGRPTC